MGKKNMVVFIPVMFCLAVTLFGCAHSLEVKNLGDFTVPVSYEKTDKKLNLGVMPFNGNSDETWYYNAIVERLYAKPDFGTFKTNYIPGRGDSKPDYTISIEPKVSYESSGWNFLISWPGFLILTPAWNGYVYYANVKTNVVVYDSGGKEIRRREVDTPYSIRHADFERTFWDEGMGWLGPGFSAIALFGGVHHAIIYDDDATTVCVPVLAIPLFIYLKAVGDEATQLTLAGNVYVEEYAKALASQVNIP